MVTGHKETKETGRQTDRQTTHTQLDTHTDSPFKKIFKKTTTPQCTRSQIQSNLPNPCAHLTNARNEKFMIPT